jgi:hypothetical protein
MTRRAVIKLHAIVMGVFALSLLSITASDVQAKVKSQYCPQDEVMVGLDETGSIVCAGVVNEPAPLTERIVFVSSTTHTGDLGGIEGADNICTNLAEAAGLYRGYKFKAWLSDSTHSPAADFVRSVVKYVNTMGYQVADDYEDLTDYTLDNPIRYDENGHEPPEQLLVWTGTEANGELVDIEESCSGWTSDNYEDYGWYGEHGVTVEEWTKHRKTRCRNLGYIYCFEQ